MFENVYAQLILAFGIATVLYWLGKALYVKCGGIETNNETPGILIQSNVGEGYTGKAKK